MSKHRDWVLTCWKEPIIAEKHKSKVVFMIGQPEKGHEKERLHWQMYVEFKNVMRVQEVKNVFNDNTIHCEPRKGTQKEAIAYCTKEDTKVGERIKYGKPKMQGGRSELDSILEAIECGTSIKEILKEFRGVGMRNIHLILTTYNVLWTPDLTKGEKIANIAKETGHNFNCYGDNIPTIENASEVAGNTVPPLNESEEEIKMPVLKKKKKLKIRLTDKAKELIDEEHVMKWEQDYNDWRESLDDC